MLERERGSLTLTLEDGSVLPISERHLTFKLQGPAEQRISVYRLRILPSVPEHLAAGYTPAPLDEALADLVRQDEESGTGAPIVRFPG